jgi:hypothetical protein
MVQDIFNLLSRAPSEANTPSTRDLSWLLSRSEEAPRPVPGVLAALLQAAAEVHISSAAAAKMVVIALAAVPPTKGLDPSVNAVGALLGLTSTLSTSSAGAGTASVIRGRAASAGVNGGNCRIVQQLVQLAVSQGADGSGTSAVGRGLRGVALLPAAALCALCTHPQGGRLVMEVSCTFRTIFKALTVLSLQPLFSGQSHLDWARAKVTQTLLGCFGALSGDRWV